MSYQYSDSAPSCPPPWRAEYDQSEQTWVFINTETGECSYQNPIQGSSSYGDMAGMAAGEMVGEGERAGTSTHLI